MELSTFFLGFSAALSALFAFGEFFSSNKSKNIYLGFVFLFLSLFVLQSFLWSSRLILNYPHLLHIHMPTTVLVGAFLERYLVLVWENQFESLKKFAIKCIASVSVVIFSIPLFLKPASDKINYINKCYQEGTPFRSKMVILAIISILFYFFVRILLRFKKLFRSSTFYSSKTLQLIFAVLIFGFVGIIIGGFYAINGSYIGMETNGYLFGSFLVLLYILRMRNPEIFQEVRKIVEEEKKYKNSQLKSIDLEDVEKKIKTLLEVNKIYREDTLSLSELASRIGISNHQLSEYINQELKVSFFQLIHKYRIEEAKERLIESPDEAIISIAYKVGYQSKSTFNEIFKKETGLTPSEFRKRIKK